MLAALVYVYNMSRKRILLAVTGASGMAYALALAENLGRREDVELHLIVSRAAEQVLAIETGLGPEDLARLARSTYAEDDLAAPPASGSWPLKAMVVCPCTMASLAAIARGLGTNLIHRAADVCLKERRRLVLVPRETPLSAVHLENMLAAHRAGAVILPACPGFYHRPANLDDLTAHLAGRILDQLDIPHALFPRWGEPQEV